MRATDPKFLIGGAPVLLPDAGVELQFTDLDSADSGRDEAGFMHRIVLRRGVRTWTLGYSLLTKEEYAYMQRLLLGSDTFLLTYENEQGQTAQTTAYCSNHALSLFDRERGVYRELKCTVIEC